MDGIKPLAWRKSSYSAAGDNCVEVAPLLDGCHVVRDSKNPGGPLLSFTQSEWLAFVGGVKAGYLN